MKRWLTLSWLFLSGAWVVWLNSVPLVQNIQIRKLLNPEASLFVHIGRECRQSLLLLAVFSVLVAGLFLEIIHIKPAAAYVNVGFYIAYALWWVPALVTLLRGGSEPGALPFIVVFGGSALIILVVNMVLYRRVWRNKAN